MKTITLKHYREPLKSSVYIKDKFYSIYLESGQSYTFSDRKDVQSFLTSLSKTLTYFTHELTLISGEIWSQAAECWILFDEVDERIFRQIYDVIQMTSYLFERKSLIQSSANGNNIALTKIRNSASYLIDITDRLIMLNKKRNLTMQTKRAEMLKNRIEYIYKATFEIDKHLEKK